MKVCLACEEQFAADDWHCPNCGHSPILDHGHPVLAPHLAQHADGFRPELFAEVAKVEQGNFWVESRNQLLFWAMRKYFPNAGNFLEIGCGTGFVLSGIRKEFPQLRLAGTDVFVEALPHAEAQVPEGTFFQMDACRIPFDSEFDIIGAFDVLEHIEEDSVVLSQMFRATRRGGGIMLMVPQHRFLWSIHDESLCHKRRYSRRELVMKVRSAGFEVICATGFVSLLLPLMLLSRIKQSSAPHEYDPLSALRIGGFVNSALRHISDFERVLIKGGLSFPVGGSLLVVARHP